MTESAIPLIQYLLGRRNVLLAELRHVDDLLGVHLIPYAPAPYDREKPAITPAAPVVRAPEPQPPMPTKPKRHYTPETLERLRKHAADIRARKVAKLVPPPVAQAAEEITPEPAPQAAISAIMPAQELSPAPVDLSPLAAIATPRRAMTPAEFAAKRMEEKQQQAPKAPAPQPATRTEALMTVARAIDAKPKPQAPPDPVAASFEFVARWAGERGIQFREVRRVLRDDGVLWLNLGDSYAGGAQSGAPRVGIVPGAGGKLQGRNRNGLGAVTGAKPKDLIGIPWMVAFALRADGWYLRSDIIWAKPNPMPESVTDRPTRSHEFVFLLSKSARYFYDTEAVRQPMAEASYQRLSQDVESQRGSSRANGGAKTNGPMKAVKFGGNKGQGEHGSASRRASGNDWEPQSARANLKSVWSIATQPFKGSHFATMPPDLAERCILAGTSERGCCPSCGAPWTREISKTRTRDGEPLTGGYNSTTDHRIGPTGVGHWRDKTVVETTGWGPSCQCPEHRPIPQTVLDPFSGAGTTALVADRLGRSAIGIELNPDYAAMGSDRVRDDAPLFAEVTA